MATSVGLNLVKFESAKKEFDGVKELTLVGQGIRHVENRKYLVTREQCAFLKQRGVDYEILKKL